MIGDVNGVQGTDPENRDSMAPVGHPPPIADIDFAV
jgi:hypothetical protein